MRDFKLKRQDLNAILTVAKKEAVDLGRTLLADTAEGVDEARECLAVADGYFAQLQAAANDRNMDDKRFASNVSTVKASLTKKLLAIKNEKALAMVSNILNATFGFLEGIVSGFGKFIGFPIG